MSAAGGMSEEAYMQLMGITPKVIEEIKEMRKFFVHEEDPAWLSSIIDKIYNEFCVRLKSMDWKEKSYFASHIRDPFVRSFSWAIPYSSTLAKLGTSLKGYSRILEVGAGTGLWAHLLKELHGIPVIPTDQSDGNYDRHKQYRYCSVEVIDSVAAIAKHDPEVLLLIWAPFSDPGSPFPEPPMATNSLKAFKGNLLVWVGEGHGGCNGDDSFFKELDENWEYVDQISMPRWYQINDECVIYQRKEPNPAYLLVAKEEKEEVEAAGGAGGGASASGSGGGGAGGGAGGGESASASGGAGASGSGSGGGGAGAGGGASAETT